MRKPVVCGIFLISLLVIVTSVFTSMFISPLIVKAKQPPRRSGMAAHGAPRLTLGNKPIRRPRPGFRSIPSSEWAKHGLGDSQITRSVRLLGSETVGNQVHLQASATLFDPRPGIRYVWWVRLFEGNEKNRLFFDKLYTQAFAVPAEGMTPTFEDVLALPVDPGSYVVDVGLITFSPDRNLAGERQKKLKNGDLVCGSAKIVVGN